jgi:phosphoribosylformylglycinamidine cyclo-ligase
MSKGLSYRDAGVDLDAAERAKEGLADLVASTRDRFTLSELGDFGGLYAVPPDLAAPVLVSSADGVGTKLKGAFAAKRHETVGQCLVNHCVNDILVQGARPLFFLDYLATGVMERDKLLDGSRIREGDALVGLASSGLHTNGYTLARRIVFDVLGLGPDDELPGSGRSVADEAAAQGGVASWVIGSVGRGAGVTYT